MRFGLRWWLAVALAALAAATAIVAVYAVSSRTDARFRQNAESLAVGNAVATAESLRAAESETDLKRRLRIAAAAHRMRVFLLDASGHQTSSAGLPPVAFRSIPETAAAARAARRGDRFIDDLSDGTIVVGFRVSRHPPTTLVAVAGAAELRQQLGVVHDAVLRAALWATILGAAVGLVIATLIGRRLERIAGVAEAITEGDLTVRTHVGFPDEIGSLAQSIETMRERLAEREKLERAQRDFATNAAHELRTPVAAIMSSVEMLQTGAKEEPEARDAFIDAIDDQSRRLARLTRALLTLARAQAGQEEPRRERVAVRPLLERLAAEAQTRDGVAIEVEGGPASAWANVDLLEQALSAAVGNAVRHTRHGRIVLRSEPNSSDGVWLSVTDTGPGMSPEQREHAFERFYRGVDTRDGFGLGLAIVKQATEAMGGTVELDSRHGAGTTVRFHLPSGSPS